MISAWHLLWIVPLAAMGGFFMAALCAAAKNIGVFDGEDIIHPVRCKDCAYYWDLHPDIKSCDPTVTEVTTDDFCSSGERRVCDGSCQV